MITKPNTRQSRSLVALLPFLVKGALSLIVLREMRERGLSIAVAYYMPEATGYTRDPLEDFQETGDLIDLTGMDDRTRLETLVGHCESREVGLVLQAGAAAAYHHLHELRRRCPQVNTLDMLYNPVGHVVNHFLYENAFDGAIVESQSMQQFYVQNSQKAKPLVHLVESGIDLSDFALSERPDRPMTVGYVGRLSPEKNPVGFIQMVEAVHQRLPDLRFLMFGEGALLPEVRALVESSPAREVLQFKGYAKHPKDAFGQIDVLVVPSTLDGRPNAIMEANACGVPVIAAPVGGIPELIEDEVNGTLIGPLAYAKFEHTLNSWRRRDELARLRASARRLAVERFDRNRMMDIYQRIFEQYVDPGAGDGRRPGDAPENGRDSEPS